MKTPRSLLTLAAGIAAASLAACDEPTAAPGGHTDHARPAPTQPADRTPSADNTANNKRDAEGVNKTPMDQGNNQADIDITANIRKAIVDNDAMSTNAQNIKIITENGVVTLRGVVESETERTTIEERARSVPGVVRVESQLEVKTP